MSLKNILKRSRSKGNAIELFRFVYGEGSADQYLYTSAERPVEFNGETFNPISISRGKVKQGSRQNGVSVSINVSKDSNIARIFQGQPPRRMIGVQIYEGDIPEATGPTTYGGPPSLTLLHEGTVVEAQHKGDETTLTCNDTGFSLRRPGLFRFYQRTCGHVLYGSRCGADRAAATKEFTVGGTNEPSGRLIWTSTGSLSDLEKEALIGGTVEWQGPFGSETRVVTAHNNALLTVDTPVDSVLFIGDSINVVLGCARSLNACISVHDNVVNFGGMPYINEEDPENKNNHT